MLIVVKTILENEISVQVKPTDKVATIKEKVFQKEKAPLDFMRLVDLALGRKLEDHKLVKDYNLQHGAILHLGVIMDDKRTMMGANMVNPGEDNMCKIETNIFECE